MYFSLFLNTKVSLPLPSPHVLWVVLGNFGHQASVSFSYNLLYFIDSTAVDFINDFFIFFLRKEPCCLDTFCKWLLFFTCRFGGIAMDFSCSYCMQVQKSSWQMIRILAWRMNVSARFYPVVLWFDVTFSTTCCRAGVLMTASDSLPMRESPPPHLFMASHVSLFPCITPYSSWTRPLVVIATRHRFGTFVLVIRCCSQNAQHMLMLHVRIAAYMWLWQRMYMILICFVTSLVRNPGLLTVYKHGRGRPGSIYHMNYINVYLRW